MAEVNASGTNFPPDVSEFDAAGVRREAGRTVGVPRVGESPVALECRLDSTLPVGDFWSSGGHPCGGCFGRSGWQPPPHRSDRWHG
ncbi:flavin reductase family protein [Arthrobacter sp. NPDC057013]|uniref:flavin reductase family protein n=1 Tax=Arthrobacter sp. NPDC057013 TaxID=3345999 RepID=UPI00362871DD